MSREMAVSFTPKFKVHTRAPGLRRPNQLQPGDTLNAYAR